MFTGGTIWILIHGRIDLLASSVSCTGDKQSGFEWPLGPMPKALDSGRRALRNWAFSGAGLSCAFGKTKRRALSCRKLPQLQIHMEDLQGAPETCGYSSIFFSQGEFPGRKHVCALLGGCNVL